jgi:hypothetical protein
MLPSGMGTKSGDFAQHPIFMEHFEDRGVNDILVLIESNPGITVSNIKSLLNIPQKTIERWINQ